MTDTPNTDATPKLPEWLQGPMYEMAGLAKMSAGVESFLVDENGLNHVRFNPEEAKQIADAIKECVATIMLLPNDKKTQYAFAVMFNNIMTLCPNDTQSLVNIAYRINSATSGLESMTAIASRQAPSVVGILGLLDALLGSKQP